MNVGCVLMAAGSGSRFGENKLAALYREKPLYIHALAAIPADMLYKVVVVTQYDEIRLAAELRGYKAVLNLQPELGISRTIALGLSELSDADAAMFLVCDQPRLTANTVRRELELFQKSPGRIVALGDGERRGNPAVFPREFFPELRGLSADSGGSEVIRRHEERLLLMQVDDPAELFDVDSVMELERLKGMG